MKKKPILQSLERQIDPRKTPKFWEIIPKPLGSLGPQASKVLTCDPGFAVDGKAMVWRRSVVCLFLIQIEKAKHASETRWY